MNSKFTKNLENKLEIDKKNLENELETDKKTSKISSLFSRFLLISSLFASFCNFEFFLSMVDEGTIRSLVP